MLCVGYQKEHSVSIHFFSLFHLRILFLQFYTYFLKNSTLPRSTLSCTSSIKAADNLVAILQQDKFGQINNRKKASRTLCLTAGPCHRFCLFEEPFQRFIVWQGGGILIFDFAVSNNFDQPVKKPSESPIFFVKYICSTEIVLFRVNRKVSWEISPMIVHALLSEEDSESPFQKVSESSYAAVMERLKIWMKEERSQQSQVSGMVREYCSMPTLRCL